MKYFKCVLYKTNTASADCHVCRRSWPLSIDIKGWLYLRNDHYYRTISIMRRINIAAHKPLHPLIYFVKVCSNCRTIVYGEDTENYSFLRFITSIKRC